MKIFKKFFNKATKTTKKDKREQKIEVENIDQQGPISKSLDKNIETIKNAMGNSSDIKMKKFNVSDDGSIKMAIVYTDGLIDKTFVHETILKSLMIDIRKVKLDSNTLSSGKLLEVLKDSSIPAVEINEITDFNEVFIHLLSGNAILFLDGTNKALELDAKGWESRGVTEPSSQTVIRGPKDSFCETLLINLSLIRRRIKDTNLWIEIRKIGRRTKTDVAIAYINGIASDGLIEELHKRLDRIDIDGLFEGGYIEELIQDETFTVFPTIYNTERPDTVASGLLEGRVAIIVDGTPFVLIAPTIFIDFFQSAEDYYQRADIASLVRLLRFTCFFIALLTPSIYVAITTFHQEMVPTLLLTSLVAQREGVPFPAFVEALTMELTFEILREAGVRMPRAIGPAISIVGALVLGEAAVQAGIVSPAMVIVVSLTAISSFIFPSYNMAITVRILRFIFMALGASFGLYGIAIGLIVAILHVCSLRSFGIPYMVPMAPFNLTDQKDALVRFPLWAMFKRPRLISQKSIYKQKRPRDAKPKKPSKE